MPRYSPGEVAPLSIRPRPDQTGQQRGPAPHIGLSFTPPTNPTQDSTRFGCANQAGSPLLARMSHVTQRHTTFSVVWCGQSGHLISLGCWRSTGEMPKARGRHALVTKRATVSVVKPAGVSRCLRTSQALTSESSPASAFLSSNSKVFEFDGRDPQRPRISGARSFARETRVRLMTTRAARQVECGIQPNTCPLNCFHVETVGASGGGARAEALSNRRSNPPLGPRAQRPGTSHPGAPQASEAQRSEKRAPVQRAPTRRDASARPRRGAEP